MARRIAFESALTLLLAVWSLVPPAAAADRIRVHKEAELPHREYKLGETTDKFLTDDAAVAKLAADFKKDMDDDLSKYEMVDKVVLQAYLTTLGSIAMLEHRYDDFLANVEHRKALEEMESKRLFMGILYRAYIAAQLNTTDSLSVAFRKELRSALNDLPYDKVADEAKSNKAVLETLTREKLLQGLKYTVQPNADAHGGSISRAPALKLLNSAASYRFILPLRDVVVEELDSWISSHTTTEPAGGTGR